MINIEKIIYDTTRGLHGIEDKLRIATIFIFCYKMGSQMFSELLYCQDKEKFINSLNKEYEAYEVDFSIRLNDKNVRDCFNKTLESVKLKYDSNGFYKAVFEKDEFAMVILEITKTRFDKNDLKKVILRLPTQLKLF